MKHYRADAKDSTGPETQRFKGLKPVGYSQTALRFISYVQYYLFQCYNFFTSLNDTAHSSDSRVQGFPSPVNE